MWTFKQSVRRSLYLFIIYLGWSTSYAATVAVKYAALSSTATLVCTFATSPSFRDLEWKIGEHHQTLIYADYTDPSKDGGPRGTFIGRDVTGKFNAGKTTHTLNIATSIISDEGHFFCTISGDSVPGMADLVLVVPPQPGPYYQVSWSQQTSSVNCHNPSIIPSKTTKKAVKLTCVVSKSKPVPSVDFDVTGNAEKVISDEKKTTSTVDGAILTRVERTITITPNSKTLVRCRYQISDPSMRERKQEYLCYNVAPDSTNRGTSDFHKTPCIIVSSFTIILCMALAV